MKKLKSIRIRRAPFLVIRNIIFVQIILTVFFYAMNVLVDFDVSFDALPILSALSYSLVLMLLISFIEILLVLVIFGSWLRNFYEFKMGEVVHISGLLIKHTESVALDNVVSITHSQDPVGRLFKYGTVQVKKAGLNEKIKFNFVPKPERFIQHIKRYGGKGGKSTRTTLDVQQLLERQENDQVEFKSSLRWDTVQNKVNKNLEKAMLKSIAGFLNSQGGRVVVGVDDQGNVLGLTADYQTLPKKNADGFENHLSQIFRKSVGVEFRRFVQPSFHTVGKDQEICVVTVLPSDEPVYVKWEGQEEFFIRTGNSTTNLSISEATNYIKSRWS